MFKKIKIAFIFIFPIILFILVRKNFMNSDAPGISISKREVMSANNESHEKDNVLFFEDFSDGMDNWWVEGGEKVWVQDGRLHVKADPENENKFTVCTVWYKKEFPANIQVEFDAHVIQSSKNVNNINFFLSYSDPSGKPLYETRESRKSAKYEFYHKLNGNIFTFLRASTYQEDSDKARIRIRHNPGFNLLAEKYDYHCKQGNTYHITITKIGGDLKFAVDGKVYLTTKDDKPLGSGLIGLRTFRTYLWWDNIKVTEIKTFN